MSLIVLGAGKGAPGVTTASVALAAVWPRRAVVAECDPSGADLALRLTGEDGRPLAQDHGLLSLATAVRSNAGDVSLRGHVQTVAGGLDVLVGSHTSRQAAALQAVWGPVGLHLSGTDEADVLADCGRLTPPTVALQLARHARLLVLVVRATPSGLAHLRALLAELADQDVPAPVAVLPIADKRGRSVPEQVTEVIRSHAGIQLVVLGPLALDPVGAAGLAGEWTRHLDRTALVESARNVAHELDALLATQLTTVG